MVQQKKETRVGGIHPCPGIERNYAYPNSVGLGGFFARRYRNRLPKAP
jgi:hypothetical protein